MDYTGRHTSSHPIWHGRPLCRARNCCKRTVLVVSSNGRMHWKCHTHGFSHWSDVEDETIYVSQNTNTTHVQASQVREVDVQASQVRELKRTEPKLMYEFLV